MQWNIRQGVGDAAQARQCPSVVHLEEKRMRRDGSLLRHDLFGPGDVDTRRAAAGERDESEGDHGEDAEAKDFHLTMIGGARIVLDLYASFAPGPGGFAQY
jgi:hypothetical protein